MRARKLLAGVVLAMFLLPIAGMLGGIAHAEPKSALQLELLMAGQPKKLGQIVSAAGANTTNASTAAPFTIAGGSVIMLECNAVGNVCSDPTCATAITSSDYGQAVAIADGQSTKRVIWALNNSTTVISIVGPAAITCAVFVLGQ